MATTHVTGSRASLQTAIDKAIPGDTIHVAGGDYAAIVIDTPGLTIRGHGAIIDAPLSGQGVLIRANRTTISGFEVRNARGGGIVAKGAHHIIIENNHVHHNAGHGISLIKGDYFTVRGNHVHHNVGVRGRHATSGISVFNPWEFPGVPLPFRIRIIGNAVHHNAFEGRTDGFGVLLDKLARHNARPYLHPVLIQGNRLYHNGNCGAYAYHADNALIRWNWFFHNAQRTELVRPAELGLHHAYGIIARGNVIEAESGTAAVWAAPGFGCRIRSNHIVRDGTGPVWWRAWTSTLA